MYNNNKRPRGHLLIATNRTYLNCTNNKKFNVLDELNHIKCNPVYAQIETLPHIKSNQGVIYEAKREKELLASDKNTLPISNQIRKSQNP